MASTMPPSSATVSPFIRRATMKAAIWAGLAAPSRISAMVTRAVSASRSPPSMRVPRMTGHPPRAANCVTGRPSRGSGLRPSGRSSRCSPGGWQRLAPPALPEDAAPLLLGGPAPHAFLLPALERELQAGLAHRAARCTPPWRRPPPRRWLGRRSRGRVRGRPSGGARQDPWVGGQLFVSGGRVGAVSAHSPGRCKPVARICRCGLAIRRLRCGAAGPTPRRRGTGGGHRACGPTGSVPAVPSRSRPAPTPGRAARPLGCGGAGHACCPGARRCRRALRAVLHGPEPAPRRASCGVVGRPPSVLGVCPTATEREQRDEPPAHRAISVRARAGKSIGIRSRPTARRDARLLLDLLRRDGAVASPRGDLRVPLPSLWDDVRGATSDGRCRSPRDRAPTDTRHHAAALDVREHHVRVGRADPQPGSGERRGLLRRGLRLRLT